MKRRRDQLAAARELRAHGQRALGAMPLSRQWALRLHGMWRRSRVPGPPAWLTRYGPDHANRIYTDAIESAERDMPRRYRRALRGGERSAPSSRDR